MLFEALGAKRKSQREKFALRSIQFTFVSIYCCLRSWLPSLDGPRLDPLAAVFGVWVTVTPPPPADVLR
jgi:hypothetical protein